MAARRPHVAQKQQMSGPARKAEKIQGKERLEIPKDFECNTPALQHSTHNDVVVNVCLVVVAAVAP